MIRGVIIASRLANNNGGHNQDKHYELLLLGAMLERLQEAYALIVATSGRIIPKQTYRELPTEFHDGICHLRRIGIISISPVRPMQRYVSNRNLIIP